MNILIASSSPIDAGGGISTYCKEISAGLATRGHEVYFASPPPVGKFPEQLFDCNRYIATPFSKDMRALLSRLLAYIKEHEIDAIINNDNAVIQNLAPFVNCTFISVGHLESTTIASLLAHNKEWIDYIVAISSDMQLTFMNKLRLPPYRVPLIHNGIVDCFAGQSQGSVPKGDNLRIVFGGGLISRKGGDYIRTLLGLAAGDASLQFDIFGPLPVGVPSELKNVANITFHGKQPKENFLSALREADIFLLPSRAEGCPMALLEAMSAATIPIVSDGAGAMRWLVEHCENGFVCSLEDWSSQCFQLLEYLKIDRKEVSRLKASSRATFLEKLQTENTVIKLERLIFRPVVDRKRPASASKIVHWHRWPESNLLERMRFRYGIIRSNGRFEV